jgi:uncharacterized DUF497 family protein
MHKYENLFVFENNFEWDLLKEQENELKHGVTFLAAVETFDDPDGIKIIDQRHSWEEVRFHWIGKTKEEKILTTWFTKRGSRIRIIGSAELRKFRRLYENSKTKRRQD